MLAKLSLLIMTNLFFLVPMVSGQERLLTFEQLQDSVVIKPKASMLLVHTDWCTYCALQKQQLAAGTLMHKDVYFGEFNAEQKDEVRFKGETYSFKPTGRNTGIHELVEHFSQGKRVSFPFWVILDHELHVLDTYTGYLRPEELEKIVEDVVRSMRKNNQDFNLSSTFLR